MKTIEPALRHHVVVVGSGFGGLAAVRELAEADVDVTLIDRTSHHLFQPLLYQVATGIISEGFIAPTTRILLKGQKNVTVRLGEVSDIDLSDRTLTAHHDGQAWMVRYDSLIVAAGARQSYFGNDHFAEHAPGMKTVDDALEIRGRIMNAFEQAETCTDPIRRRQLLTFVIVGAGPTGVEMAGQIRDLADRTLPESYRAIDTRDAEVILLDSASSVLPAFAPGLRSAAQRSLTAIGVDVRLGVLVTEIDSDGITFEEASGSHRIEATCKIWSAGVCASPLTETLAAQSGAATDRANRIVVRADLSLPNHPNVFVVGDMMARDKLPGVAQVAVQAGRYAGGVIAAAVAEPGVADLRPPFVYREKGSMAIISRFSAVALIGNREITGFFAWISWLAVHVMYMAGNRRRLSTLLSWFWAVSGGWRGHLTVTTQQVTARNDQQRLRSMTEATSVRSRDPIVDAG